MAKKQTKKTIPHAVLQDKQNMQAPAPAKQGPSARLKLIILLGCISCIVYANTLKNDFVLDDSNVITENTIVKKGITAIPEILITPYRWGIWASSNDLYRPLSLVMFAAEYQVFKKNAVPYHLMNILLFAGCVIFLFLFLDRLFEGKKTAVAFIASLLFALHPIHTEVVANIKSCDELLCFFFAFLSLNIFIKYGQTGEKAKLLLGAFCFFLSFLAKETVITFLAVIPLIFFFYADRDENKKRSFYITVSVIVAAIVCLAMRYSVLNYYHANEAPVNLFEGNALAKPDLAFDSRIATAVLILGYYAKLLFIPYPLVCDYSYNSIPFAHFSDLPVLISLAFYIFLVIFGVRRFIKNQRDPFAFAILFYLITLSLFSNIPFLIGTTMGERLIFLPSAGFCLCMGLIVEKWMEKSPVTGVAILKTPKVLGVLIPVSVIFAVLTIKRNSDWLDNYTLYKTDVVKVPNSNKLNYWMGLELQKMVDLQEKDPIAQKQTREEEMYYFRKSLAIYPRHDVAMSDIGNLYFHSLQYDSAEAYEKRAIELNPKSTEAINVLAGVYFSRKKYAEAIELCENAIKLNPKNTDLYTNIAAGFGTLGKYDSAICYLYKAISIDPNFVKSYENLATTYRLMGKLDSAKKYEMLSQKKLRS